MIDTLFHPAVAAWFSREFAAPSPPQLPAWSSIKSGRHTLIAAPTGSGKTLAAFLAAIDDLVRRGEEAALPDAAHVVYVSPLKALSNDIQKNLQLPLEGISRELNARGRLDHGIRVLVRTGDTPAGQRTAMAKKPPHVVVTTPESLYILLTSESGRRMLAHTRSVIVDEIHALVGTKRGSHLALTLERLEHLVGGGLLRVGLSATQKPIEDVARFLVGSAHVDASGAPDCTIVDAGHRRELDLAIEVPGSPLEPVMSHEVWEEVYDRIAALIAEHRTTLVFVNTRRLAERVTRLLAERIGEANVTSHHGSLSKEHRLQAEQRLKAGALKALVATASLELGIDIGDVDLVCQIGSTRAIATFLQRVGRSGHFQGGIPKGRLFPLTRDELVEAAALFDAVRRGELDRLNIPEQPLDILAQQITAMTVGNDWPEDELFDVVRRAWPYRELSRADFDAVVRMLADGFNTRRGRRSAYLHRDVIQRKLRARRGARLTAITSGGAIPDNADYRVLLEPSGTFVGTVNEDFAIESSAGDIFQLGNMSWRIQRVESGTVRVEDAKGQPPTIPFWLGEAPSRTAELSAAVSRFREDVAARLPETDREPSGAAAARSPQAGHEPAAPSADAGGAPGNEAVAWLTGTVGLSEAAAVQIVGYLAAAQAPFGVMPSQNVIVLERFFDESGGMQLVLHAPFGGRVNRAWGLALRKRFCVKFNFELQAAATEDAVVLSLGPTHSFPLDDVFRYLSPVTVEHVLTQAVLTAPMFPIRWRWVAGRSLAVPRFRGGKKVPPPLQRMQAEDLLALVFPDQIACAENLAGEREVPDHPLARQAVEDCLREAMDVDGLKTVLQAMRDGEKTLVARDLREPSPLAAEVLNAKPYAFLDDAPLEERRTQAVMSRRWLDPETARNLGALDAAAIDRVRAEAWPEARDADELADGIAVLGFLTVAEAARAPEWEPLLESLLASGRVARACAPGGVPVWLAVERVPQWRGVFPEGAPGATLPRELMEQTWTRDEALRELVRSRLEALGPVTPAALAEPVGLTADAVVPALLALESEGAVFRGTFTPGPAPAGDGPARQEWCDRRLLARIHRYTLQRLRAEIEPVTAAVLLRFLLRWQGVTGERPEGPDSLARAVDQLEGFSAPAAAWEGDILPARLARYDPTWLDGLCLSGRVSWARLAAPAENGLDARAVSPVRSTPVCLVGRAALPAWVAERGNGYALTDDAQRVRTALQDHGASFFDDVVRTTGLLAAQVESALRELVALGLVTSDGFSGLRALLVPAQRRQGYRARALPPGMDIREAGRWGLVRIQPTADVEHVARALLRRYGVVFRRILERESLTPSWRDLVYEYRRLEARGEIRGGRFVAGFTGEQYALPEAVEALRATRRRGPDGELAAVSAADPLNLVGILTPGDRVPALAGNRVLYREGEPVAVRVAGEDRLLVGMDEPAAWEARRSLVRSPAPPRLRAYLNRS